MAKHITIRIKRPENRMETIHGTVIGETDSGFICTYEGNPVGEWFAKDSAKTTCVPHWEVN